MAFHFDDILTKYIGDFKKYQKRRLAFIAILGSIIVINSTFSSIFIANTPRHHCILPKQLEELQCNNKQKETFAIPSITSKNGEIDQDSCRIYVRNYTLLTEEDVCPKQPAPDSISAPEIRSKQCDAWVYEKDNFASTIVTEWNLVCDKADLFKNVAGIYMAATIIGVFLAGLLADRFGRKPIIAVYGFGEGIAFLLSGFMPFYGWFASMRLIMGFFSNGFSAVLWIICLECVGVNYRAWSYGLINVCFSLARLGLAGTAYIIIEWRHLSVLLGAAEIVFVILITIYLDESSRWQLTAGKDQLAWATLKAMATENRKNVVDDIDIMREGSRKERGILLDLIRTPTLRRITLISLFAWFVVAFVYFGADMNISELGRNPYQNLCIIAAVELPAYLIGIWLVESIGRVWTYSVSFLTTGIILLCVSTIPADATAFIGTLGILGKFSISITFQTAFLYTAEIYSTSVRAMTVTTCSAVARLGAMFAIYSGVLMSVHRSIPQVIFAIASLAAGCLVLALPESYEIPLMQSVREAEKHARENYWHICDRFFEIEEPIQIHPESEIMKKSKPNPPREPGRERRGKRSTPKEAENLKSADKNKTKI